MDGSDDARPQAARTHDELTEGIRQRYANMQAGLYDLLKYVAECVQRGTYEVDGARSMEEWLVEALSITRTHANELVRVACRLAELPALSEAYASGRLSWDQLCPIASVATPTTDSYLAQEVPGYSAEQCRDLARHLRRVGATQARDAHRRRGLRFWWDDECLRLSGRLGDTDGAAVAKALTHLADNAEPHTEIDGSKEYEPFEARCADGLVQLASSYLSLSEDADRATVVIHADAEVVFADDPLGEARIEDGPDIANSTLRRLLCDTRWQLLAERPDGQAVGVGRVTRSVPAWLVRQLKRRDGGCRFPGCGRKRWLHAHHLLHWADGGATDPDNLVMLCGQHHRLLHDDDWKTSGSPNGALSFRSPIGRQFTTMPSPLTPEVRDMFKPRE